MIGNFIMLVEYTGRSNGILHRKLKYFICCLSGIIVKIGRALLNNTYDTSISGVKFSWTTLYLTQGCTTRSTIAKLLPQDQINEGAASKLSVNVQGEVKVPGALSINRCFASFYSHDFEMTFLTPEFPKSQLSFIAPSCLGSGSKQLCLRH